MKAQKKIWDFLIACGGTFGHIRPALSLAEELERQGYRVALFCSEKDKKFPLIQERPASKIFFLRMGGFPTSKNPLSWLSFCWKLLGGILKTGWFFLIHKPRYLVVSGSFISYPSLFWARFFKVRYSILEQNSVPGFVSRRFFSKAQHVFFALTPIRQEDRHLVQAQIVGNPLNLPHYTRQQAEEFFHWPAVSDGKTIVGVIGGSLGAKSLVEWAISQKTLLEKEQIFLFCITGEGLFQAYQKEGSSYLKLVPFVKEISYFYALCDFIVARAGASTISELIYFQKPAFFVPYPFATENHQNFNAQEALRSLPGEMALEESFNDYSAVDIVKQLTEKVHSSRFEQGQEYSQALQKITKILMEEL